MEKFYTKNGLNNAEKKFLLAVKLYEINEITVIFTETNDASANIENTSLPVVSSNQTGFTEFADDLREREFTEYNIQDLNDIVVRNTFLYSQAKGTVGNETYLTVYEPNPDLNKVDFETICNICLNNIVNLDTKLSNQSVTVKDNVQQILDSIQEVSEIDTQLNTVAKKLLETFNISDAKEGQLLTQLRDSYNKSAFSEFRKSTEAFEGDAFKLSLINFVYRYFQDSSIFGNQNVIGNAQVNVDYSSELIQQLKNGSGAVRTFMIYQKV